MLIAHKSIDTFKKVNMYSDIQLSDGSYCKVYCQTNLPSLIFPVKSNLTLPLSKK